MAIKTTVTSGDYKLRPLVLADFMFIAECMGDFPIGHQWNMSGVMREMDVMLLANSLFDTDRTADVNSPQGFAHVLEYNDTPVGFRYAVFEDNIAELRMQAISPAHRGNKHATALGMLQAYWMINTLSIISAFAWAIDEAKVAAHATNWSSAKTVDEEMSKSERPGTQRNMFKYAWTPAEWTAVKDAHSTWGSASFTVS